MSCMTSTPRGTHNDMSRLVKIAASTLLSGGILNNGTLGGYISDATRRALGMGLAE